MADVPKFGSFRKKSPKPALNASDESLRSHARPLRKNSDALEDRVALASRHHGRQREFPSFKRGLSPHKRSHRIVPSSRAGRPISETPEPEYSDAYLIDVRGDAKNAQYGSLHRADVPLYRRAGYGAVIGTSPLAYIDQDASTDRELYFRAPNRSARQRTLKPLSSKHGKPTASRYRIIRPRTTPYDALEDDFIHLQPPHKRMRISGSPAPSSEMLVSNPDYRSIEGRANPTAHVDGDLVQLGPDSESDHVEDDIESSVRLANSRLLKTARANPLQVNLWLKLSDHQAQVLQPGLDATLMTSSRRKSLAKMRLSILDEASKHIGPSHPDRANLLSAVVDETSSLLNMSKTVEKWDEVLREHPKDVILSTKYLDHLQGEAQNFDYDKMKARFIWALAIVNAANMTSQSHTLQLQQVHLLARMISFIRDAGYTELATAIWQAVLEYRFFQPPELRDASLKEKQESFKMFWENDVSRIGEEGSLGWTEFAALDKGPKRIVTDFPYPQLDQTNLFASFSENELTLSRICILPTSGEDVDESEDPFRSVMYQDFSGIMEHLDAGLPEDATINAFLGFYNLPPMATRQAERDDRMYLTGAYLVTDANDPIHRNASETGQFQHKCTLQDQMQTTLELFGSSFDSFQAVSGADGRNKQVLYCFLDRCIESLVSVLPWHDALGEYLLAWKLHAFPDTAKKVAKRLLKSRPSNLRLYNAFALLELATGRLAQAKEVWSTALRMRSSLSTESQSDAILLWHTSLVSLAQKGDEEAALECAFGVLDETPSADTKPGSISRQLRATQALKTMFDRCMLAGDLNKATLYADTHAWLSYLTNACSIPSTLATYKSKNEKMTENSSAGAAELLVQCKITLLRHHLARKRPFKPSMWVEDLQQDLSRFPFNSVLLEMHAQMASHDRLRNIMHEHQSSDPRNTIVVEWGFKLSAEIRALRVDGSGRNVNTLRSLFNKALLHPESIVKHSPELWAMWLTFEYDYAISSDSYDIAKPANLQPAKRVFLDGFRYLPWYKHWALLGIRYLGERLGGLDKNEMRQVYETLVERGIRIRLNLDHYL